MTVRKRHGHYYTDFYIRGKRIVRKVPGGITNKEIAQQYESALKIKMLKGEIGIDRPNPPLAELIARYLDYSRTNKALSSYQRNVTALKNFQSISGLKKYSDVNPLALEKYKAKRAASVSSRTVNIEVTTIKAMFNKLVEWGVVPENPIISVGKIRGPESKPIEFLTEEEIEALLEASTPTLYPIIYTFLKTGLRKSELVHLEWSDVDFDKKQIRIINKDFHSTKGYKERHIPIDESLIEVLRPLKKHGDGYIFPTRDGALRANNLIREVKRLAKKAGVKKNVTVHMLRHTYASHLVMSGVDLTTVKKLLGHSDFSTTLRYSHLAPEHLQEAVNKLPF